jgi:thioredoxin-like negative regulator of GroEL
MRPLTAAAFHKSVTSGATLVVEIASDGHPDSARYLLADQYPDAVFGRVDPLAEPDIPALFGLHSVPALLIFREGIGLYIEPGYHETVRIAGLLKQVCALDMQEVKAKLEQERLETSVHMHRMCPAARRGQLL